MKTCDHCEVCDQPCGYEVDSEGLFVRDQPDPCLGWIDGAVFACCGHGIDDGGAYLVIRPGRLDAFDVYVERMKAAGLIRPGDFMHGYRYTAREGLDSFYLRHPGEEDHTIEGESGVVVLLDEVIA